MDQDASGKPPRILGRLMLASRWLMAPFYLGLLVGLALLLVKFVQKLIALFPTLLGMTSTDMVLSVLALVDLSLVANLVLIVVLAGWNGFVDGSVGGSEADQPAWLSLDFSGIKLKLLSLIATIAAIELLESFMHIASLSAAIIQWQLAIVLGIGVLGVLLAAMDRIGHAGGKE